MLRGAVLMFMLSCHDSGIIHNDHKPGIVALKLARQRSNKMSALYDTKWILLIDISTKMLFTYLFKTHKTGVTSLPLQSERLHSLADRKLCQNKLNMQLMPAAKTPLLTDWKQDETTGKHGNHFPNQPLGNMPRMIAENCVSAVQKEWCPASSCQ